MAESGLTKNQILSELSRSPHGKLSEYVPVAQQAAKDSPEFYAHLIAWDAVKGQIRDSKVALPVIGLTVQTDDELKDNSYAHLAMLNPREMVRAFSFSRELKLGQRSVQRFLAVYLKDKEKDWNEWQRIALMHHKPLARLYAISHTKATGVYGDVLFKHAKPKGSLFEVVNNLSKMDVKEAAGAILNYKLPFLIAQGALGKKMFEPDLVLALLDRISPTELVTHIKMLEKMGVKTNPALKGAFEKALERAASSKKTTLKTTKAAEAIDDEGLKSKLRGLQERQIQAIGGVDGNWLVLGDKSGSMKQAIEVATEVSATLAKMVKGKVWLVFFDVSPQTIEVTGKPLDEIKKLTRHIRAGGGTSIGCGLQRMLDAKEEVDGIAVVSDADENTTPYFADVYKKYSAWAGKDVPVYLYLCKAGMYDMHATKLQDSMKRVGADIQVFDIQRGVDFYALPNLVQSMRTNRYSLIDEVMATPLLSLKDILKIDRKEVLVHA